MRLPSQLLDLPDGERPRALVAEFVDLVVAGTHQRVRIGAEGLVQWPLVERRRTVLFGQSDVSEMILQRPAVFAYSSQLRLAQAAHLGGNTFILSGGFWDEHHPPRRIYQRLMESEGVWVRYDGGGRAVETTEELLGDASIDAILVATPTAMHFEHAMAALGAGKHVMVHAEGTEGIKAATRAGVDSVEHGTMLDEQGAALMEQHGTWLVPTLYTFQHGVEQGTSLGADPIMAAKARPFSARNNSRRSPWL